MTNYRKEEQGILRDFLRDCRAIRNLSEKTISEYFLDLRTFLRYMKVERGMVLEDIAFEEISISDIDLSFIKSISKDDIESFFAYLGSDRVIREGMDTEVVGLKLSSRRRKIASIKSFFNYLCEHERYGMEKNPSISLRMARDSRGKELPTVLTEKEGFRVLNSIKGLNEIRDYCIIQIFFATGMRVSEIVRLNVSDIYLNEEESEFFINIVGKGNKERQAFLTEACVNALREYLAVREELYSPCKASADALFLSRKHNRISVDAVQDLVYKATLEAGRPVSPHKLRHTAATQMLSHGVDIRVVQEALGHADISTTTIYTHVNNADLRQAARANPLGRGVAEDKSRYEA